MFGELRTDRIDNIWESSYIGIRNFEMTGGRGRTLTLALNTTYSSPNRFGFGVNIELRDIGA
ncbi:hypothetical protein BOW30_12840, partial [Solemya velum gill symbiont]